MTIRKNLEELYFQAEADIADIAKAIPELVGSESQTPGNLGAGKFAVHTAIDAHLETLGPPPAR